MGQNLYPQASPLEPLRVSDVQPTRSHPQDKGRHHLHQVQCIGRAGHQIDRQTIKTQ